MGNITSFNILNLISALDLGEKSEKVRTDSIITDDDLASISPTRDMVDRPGEFKTQRTSHGQAGKGPYALITIPLFHFRSTEQIYQ